MNTCRVPTVGKPPIFSVVALVLIGRSLGAMQVLRRKLSPMPGISQARWDDLKCFRAVLLDHQLDHRPSRILLKPCLSRGGGSGEGLCG